MLRNLRILFALPLLVLFSSCLKTYDNVEIEDWEPEVAVPVLNTSLQIQDLLDNFDTGGYLQVDEDKFITLIYEGNVGTIYGEELLDIDDFSIPVIDTSLIIPYGNLPLQYDLDEVKFKAGDLSVSFNSTFPEDIDVRIIIPTLQKDGVGFEMDLMVDYNGNIPVEMSDNIDLNGYSLNFGDNKFETRYIATRSSNGERVRLNDMMLNFKNMEYDFAEGYFGNQALTMPAESIIIDLFEEAQGTNVYFEDPKIDIHLENSYGIPVVVTADLLKAETHDNGTMPITSNFDNGVSINYPSISQTGSTEQTTITLNNTTSNIADVISNNPHQIDYVFSALFNPDNNTSVRGFVEDSSAFSVNVDIELPLWIKVGGSFTHETVSNFDNEVLDHVKEAEFILFTENELPINAGVQVYFENANGIVLDSLMNAPDFIDAATVGSDGKVNSVSSNTTNIFVNQSQISNMKNATQIRVKGNISTDDLNANTGIKFYTDYGLGVQLGVKALLKDIQ